MNDEHIAKALRLLDQAEANLSAARALLREQSPGKVVSNAPHPAGPAPSATVAGDVQIIEGTFDGQKMIGPNEKTYPVPPNYASKSKLVEGDRMKLTIMPNGSFLYKQIAPVERKFVKGTLVSEDGHYRVLADGSSYKVILASVTYYKGNPGDEVTLIVPAQGEATWAAIEAILPQQNVSYDEANSL